ncbi:glycosyltransferase family A protein [Bacillus sp. RAR_GA_16]|uniref:glycosyltransferase family A protein n=1 Tax=Bacillus sp. RAR_GA_16 TaxID=2876774 RepID=UPI001CCDAFFB|nr:glycosyltransferase family A protein [Bacillus sp. RAR_GA_16]MCA0172211.1 putative rhamnosyl transferase [Bacillus sp. RAR_GA_16]
MKKKEKNVVIDIAFNNWALNDTENQRWTKEWIERRMEIFMSFTAKSLEKQTNQNFTALVQYDDHTENLVKKAMRKYKRLPKNIKMIRHSELKMQFEDHIREAKYGYFVRLDSDDLYHESFIQQLHDFKGNEDIQVLINQKGYVYDAIQDRLATVSFKSPPFYTLVYKTEDYLKGYRYEMKGHRSIIEMPHHILENRNYTIIVHAQNTSTTFKEKYESGMINDPFEKKKVLTEFLGEEKNRLNMMGKLLNIVK